MRIKPTKIDSTMTVKMTFAVLKDLINSIGMRRAESGAVLGCNEGDSVIRHIIFDTGGSVSYVTYTPDHKTLNKVMKHEWNPSKKRFSGFAHSHPGGNITPSGGDEIYAANLLASIEDLPYMAMPIINTMPDTDSFTMSMWVAHRDKPGRARVTKCLLEILELPASDDTMVGGVHVLSNLKKHGPIFDTLRINRTLVNEPAVILDVSTPNPPLKNDVVAPYFDTSNTFVRVLKAYDLPLMYASRVIAVGAGGAAGWIEDLVRAGLGQLVLIDPDTVSETNLATQQTYRRDIGRLKVDALSDRLLDINPNVVVLKIASSLDDISDDTMQDYINGSINGHTPHKTVICGLTDSFPAQARVNRIALQYGIPSLSAQVYPEGRAAEMTFTYPGVTPACHRCVLSSRYKYFLDDGKENTVTSAGTPIFATQRLNALKGFVLLALLHHGTDHPRFGHLLKRIGNRNLVQIRMDPDLGANMGIDVFDKLSGGDTRVVFDDVVWLPQDAEAPPKYTHCPDCGGIGDLRKCIGTLVSTHLPENRAVYLQANG